MAAACACPLSSQDRRVSHSSFKHSEGAHGHPLCGRYAPSIRISAEPALGRVCGLRGRPRGFRTPFGTGPIAQSARGRELIRDNEISGKNWTCRWFHTDYFITEYLFSVRLHLKVDMSCFL